MLLAQFDENKQFKMFQSVQIALAPQVHAILLSLRNLFVLINTKLHLR